ncbi:unnamed protein product, partial [Cladocopium goreaui]
SGLRHSYTRSTSRLASRPKTAEDFQARGLRVLVGIAFAASWRRRSRGLLMRRAEAAFADEPKEFQSRNGEDSISGSKQEPDELSETQEFLMSIGLSAKQLWKVQKFWSISGERVPPLSRCEMVRDYLQTEVGLNSEQLARTIADCPEVLEVFSVETLKEKVRFLEVEVGIDDDLPEIIAAYPKVFCRPILTTLRPALEFWLGTAKVSPEDFPQLLKKHAVQIWSRPQSLKPKLRFAKEVMGLSVEKVLACKTPFFRLSVAKTVAPRHFFAIQKKASGLDLEDLVGIGDAAFCKKVGAKLKEYQEWMEEWPYSQQARALSWLEPKKSSASPSGGRSRSQNQKRFRDRRFERKGRWSKWSRNTQRGVPSRGDSFQQPRFEKADDWEERFSRAEL